jgi:hypothetical protein
MAINPIFPTPGMDAFFQEASNIIHERTTDLTDLGASITKLTALINEIESIALCEAGLLYNIDPQSLNRQGQVGLLLRLLDHADATSHQEALTLFTLLG